MASSWFATFMPLGVHWFTIEGALVPRSAGAGIGTTGTVCGGGLLKRWDPWYSACPPWYVSEPKLGVVGIIRATGEPKPPGLAGVRADASSIDKD